MLVMYGFRVENGDGKRVESPLLLSGDITRLEKLFPECPVWMSRTNEIGNIRFATLEEAQALYVEMLQYYAENDLDEASYVASALEPGFKSNLPAVFDQLIEFFEKTLGLEGPADLCQAVQRRQNERQERLQVSQSEYEQRSVEFFEELGVLGPPKSAEIRSKIEAKLEEYRRRLELWKYKAPDLAFQIESAYRDTIFKILVAEAVLESEDGVNLLELYKTQFEKYGDQLNTGEFFQACGVISMYLGTPLLDGHMEISA